MRNDFLIFITKHFLIYDFALVQDELQNFLIYVLGNFPIIFFKLYPLFFVTSSDSRVRKIFSKFPTGSKNADSDGDSEPFRHPVVFVLGREMLLNPWHFIKPLSEKIGDLPGFCIKRIRTLNLYHRERILETSTLSCNEEKEEITKPPKR
jgi:hypothetical protein